MSDTIPDSLTDRLRQESGIADWNMINTHIERGAAILVAADLDLIDAACHIADDDTVTVNNWIAAGSLTRPSPAQIDEWRQTTPSFKSVVLAPYVLIQALNH